MPVSKLLRKVAVATTLVSATMALDATVALAGDAAKPPAKAPASAPAQLRPRVPADVDPKVTFEKYTLANGLEVILIPDKTVPLVAVNVWYHVGSGYEVYGRSGFAHLFEHMMFQGSKHVGDDQHFNILKKIGADGVNGTTNPDRTNYYEVVPSNQLETGLWLESDRMGFLLDQLTDKSLANQIDVVRNERRQRYDNVPYGKSLFATHAGLYPEGHPYRYLTIGKHEDLEAASVEDVKNFFRTWYVPANATLTIAGDFEVADAKAAVDKWFGKFPRSERPKAIPVPPPSIKGSETVISDDFAKLRQIKFTWHSPANFAPGDAELDIAAAALRQEGPGRLYKALVYDRQLAQSVSVFQSGSQFSGQFEIAVTLRSDASLSDVKQIVLAEIARIGKELLTAPEINRVIAANEASTIRSLETAFGRSQALQAYNHYLGDPDRITWDLDRYRKTTAENVRATVAKYLGPDNVVVVISNPSNAGAKK